MVIGSLEGLSIQRCRKVGWGWKELAASWVGAALTLFQRLSDPRLSVFRVRQDKPGLLWDWIWPAKNTRWDGTTGIWRKTAHCGIYKPKGRFLICNHSILFTQPYSWMLPHAETTEKAHTPLAFHLRSILGVEHALCKFSVRCTVNLEKD